MNKMLLNTGLSLLIAGSLANVALAADCADLSGRYCLDAKPSSDSVYLVVSQKGCTEIHLQWFDGKEPGADDLRTVDGQFHPFGDEGGFQVTERWSWIGVGKKYLQAEQDYKSDKGGLDEGLNSLYYFDPDGNLELDATTLDNGSPSMGASSIYYRVH